MLTTDIKPLTPLEHGNILLVGTKASNFDDEIRNHPRVIMWDSQQEHWSDKDLPANVQAIFITRFIGHAAFGKIIAEARKKRITIFNPEGTGMIARQVRELLDITRRPTTSQDKPTTSQETPTVVKTKTGGHQPPKLHALHEFIDWTKGPMDNVRDTLMPKAKELGIKTTVGSLTQMVYALRKQRNLPALPKSAPVRQAKITTRTVTEDISVDILDNLIKELQDVRAYLVATVKENAVLKARIDKFKKVLEG